ncbi:alpha/beta fold hydrolase [Actinoplanes sp. NPDC051633]|uniref:alpha/beta fold hydrolase n=1 Tax=Actinoplanes sp. NPDC051633 TaxID=3155670 RepID=UPI003430D4E7
MHERSFTVGDIPGILWSPAGEPGDRPLILLCHGGGQHKKAPGVLARAHHFVAAGGFAAAAIDLPGCGDRPAEPATERLREAIRAGGDVGPLIIRHNTELAAGAVPEWRAVLDALGAPVAGFWGMSMGCAVGVPLVAAEPRIKAAVLGLAGGESLAETAATIKIPVEFVVKWDDELVPRESALALFDAFATDDKTLHAYPGPHNGQIPEEPETSARFFTRHLT